MQATEVRDLLDSLYRGYPSGAILLWETAEAVPLQQFAVAQQLLQLALLLFQAGDVGQHGDATIGDVVLAVLRECLGHVVANQAAVLDGRDPEGVHQIRVGLRRLRVALTAFGDAFRAPAIEALRGRAKTLSGLFGNTRELDVFAGELLTPVEEAAKKPGLAQMRLVLEDEWKVPVTWLEDEANNTAENARKSFAILSPAGITRVYLVTHAWHMRRAQTAFENAGFQVVASKPFFSGMVRALALKKP